MLYLKQSTASQSVLIGPFVDSTDGVTAETSLTIANTDIRLSANGGNMFAKTVGGGTHDENGWYTITLDATDTATVGRLQVSCVVSGALPVFMECQVLEEVVYDALFASAAAGFASITALSTAQTDLDTITGSDGVTLATAQANYAPATAAALTTVDTVVDAILVDTGTTIPATLAGLNDPTSSTIATAVWSLSSGLAGTAGDGTIAGVVLSTEADTNELQTDDVPGLIAALDVVVDRVEADTQDIQTQIGTAGAGLTDLGGMSTAMKAEVNAEADTALTDYAAATPAQVNAEVVDALNVDTYAEPGQGTPAATTSLAAKIGYLYKNWRNRKTQTATSWELMNDDATTTDQKATVADDGTTASKTEIESGP